MFSADFMSQTVGSFADAARRLLHQGHAFDQVQKGRKDAVKSILGESLGIS